MRSIVVVALALIGGFFAGIVLSEVIGIGGFLLFDRAVGIRFLPLYLAFVCAGAALILESLARRRSR